ncbi:MAG: hypothetical protein JW940_21420 [Polyangiaceae bacterium]|nr:hypothetical protein [Polyangiaceae bacterium]
MLRWLRILSVTGVIGTLSLLTPPAAAAEEDEWGEDTGDDSGESDEADSSDEEGYPAEDESESVDNTDSTDPAEIDADAERERSDSPYEKPDETYYFAGLRYRGMVVPKFMMNLFASGGTTLYVNGFGPEASIRKNGFETIFGMWWSGYYMPNTPFKGISEHAAAYEIVKSNIQVMYLSADFMWSKSFSDMVALNYGMGAGLGIVWGDLRRNQATPPVPNADVNPEDFVKCRGVGDPPFVDDHGDPYCDNDNDHYGKYTEDSWVNGGQKPNIFPWFALQMGVRVKPHKNVATRFDVGWALTGPFFGLAAAYGF